MKFLPKCGLIISLALTTHLGTSQTAVVLINEKPTKVVLKDGKIVELKEAVPSYMDGYSKSPKDNFKKLPFEIIDDSKAIAAEANDVPIIEEVVVSESSDNVVVDTAVKEEEDNSVYFKFDSAILSPKALTSLKRYATSIKAKDNGSVLLKSWYKSGDDSSYELINNRLNACRQYLEANGIPTNMILTSLVGSNRESRFVSVFVN